MGTTTWTTVTSCTKIGRSLLHHVSQRLDNDFKLKRSTPEFVDSRLIKLSDTMLEIRRKVLMQSYYKSNSFFMFQQLLSVKLIIYLFSNFTFIQHIWILQLSFVQSLFFCFKNKRTYTYIYKTTMTKIFI